MGRKDLDSDAVRHALLEVGGEHFLSKLKDGLATEVKEGGKEFSSGERQLISFARALAQNPTILILDEATSHVDTDTEAIIQRGIERLAQADDSLSRTASPLSAMQDLRPRSGCIVESAATMI